MSPEVPAVSFSSFGLVLLAALSGFCFTAIGLAYRIGRERRVEEIYIAASLALFGVGVFAVKAFGVSESELPVSELPARVYILGGLVGFTQYFTYRMLRAALNLGPLSPMWCAVCLNFLPVIVYAGLFLGETMNGYQLLGLLAGVLTVVMGAFQQHEATDENGHVVPGRYWLYLLVLILLFAFNSAPPLGMKELGRQLEGGGNIMAFYGDYFFLALYICLAIPLLADMLIIRRPRPPIAWALGLGCLAGLGSVLGMGLQGYCVGQQLPAHILFMVGNIFSILPAALLSVAFFGERPTRAWHAMVWLGIAAVVMVNLGKH